jgi:hypothetical protein
MAALPPPDDNTSNSNNNENDDDKKNMTANAILEMLLKQSKLGADEEDEKHAFWDTQVS